MGPRGGFAVRKHMSLVSIPPRARVASADEVHPFARSLAVSIRFPKAFEQ
jgi:hypothetical protein